MSSRHLAASGCIWLHLCISWRGPSVAPNTPKVAIIYLSVGDSWRNLGNVEIFICRDLISHKIVSEICIMMLSYLIYVFDMLLWG